MPALSERESLLLALANVPGLGERGLARLLKGGLSPARLLQLPAEELRARFRLAPRAAEVLAGGEERLRLRSAPLEQTFHRYGMRVLERGAAGYPPELRAQEDPDAPPLLYAYGNLALLDRPRAAILSSRGESRAGLELTAALAGELARAGWGIVSGHNRPGYRAAGSAAKADGGCRIIVLDRGLLAAFGDDLERDLFPAARVWGYGFDRERTLFLSPYRPSSPGVGVRNRRRDRLVALLAGRILAVEIRLGGVMEGECRAARARGTPVEVWNDPAAPAGNRALLAEGFAPLQR